MGSILKKVLKRWELWLSTAMLIVGVSVLSFAVYKTVDFHSKLGDFTEISATVIDYAERRSHVGNSYKTLYAEIVEYTVDGVTYKAQSDSASNVPKGIGEHINIAYNPASPEECIFIGSGRGLCAVLFVFGASFSAFGSGLAVFLAKDLKRDRLMNIYSNAKFITSAASKSQFLKFDKPVIAVCGKSNVGKSSLINMLAGQKKLAKVSGDPGRTRLINYFDFGDFILADLPGYGYARVSKSEKAKWARLLDDFFAGGNGIAHVFALCDIRHEPTEDDKIMINYLYERIIPFSVVATKADKLSRAQIDRSLTTIAATYKCGKGDIVPTSSKTRQGLEQLIKEIDEVIERSRDEKGD